MLPTKRRFNLPRTLRGLFELLQAFTFLGALFQIVLYLVYPFFHVTITPSETIAYVEVEGLEHIPAWSSTGDAAEVKVTSVNGVLEVKNAPESAEFSSLLRWRFLLCGTPGVIFPILLFGLLRRLCSKVEQGEIFSARNTTLVRNLGITILGYQAASIVGRIWYGNIAARFVHQYVVVEGVKVGVRWDWNHGWFSPSAGLIVTGCLVLLLAEVFRQGLELKSENELTV